MDLVNSIAAYLQVSPWPPHLDGLFWPALLLAAGGLFGELIARGSRLPRVVGYSAAGVAIALAGYGNSSGQLSGWLRVIVDVALALLLFEIGSRVNLRWLQKNRSLMWTSMAEASLTTVAVFVAMRVLRFDSPIACACAILATPASAAVAGRIAMELGAEGQVSDRLNLLTALNTLYAALMLTLFTGWLHADRLGDWVAALSRFGYAFVGSFLVAALLAKLVALIARRLDLRNENSVLLLLGLIVLAITLARIFALSTLLVPLMAGMILRNGTSRPWVWPRHFGTAGGVLVLMMFVVVGSAWSLQTLAIGGLAACVLVLTRGCAKLVAIVAFARRSGISIRQGLALSVALTPVSATALVMLADLHSVHPEFAVTLAPVILSSIAMLELLGPIAVQWALRAAGDVSMPDSASTGEQQ